MSAYVHTQIYRYIYEFADIYKYAYIYMYKCTGITHTYRKLRINLRMSSFSKNATLGKGKE
jgi:hypothetical protein